MNVQSAHFAVLSSASVDSLSRHLAGAVLSGIWEGVLLALAVGLCLQLVPNITARLRFTIWMVAFAVIAVLPLFNVLVAGQTAAPTFSAGPHLQLDPRWSYALAALWLAAAIGRSVHLAMQAVRLRTLWHSAVPVSTKLLPELSLGRVELCISTDLDRPGVIGFFAPRIIIPAWLFDQLTSGELEQIALHELEHLRRRDDWVNLLQKIGLVLFPLNPALFWIDGRLAAERELACDDGVLARTYAPRAYATCLTSLAERHLERRSHNRLTALALGAVSAVRRSDFSRRIESILGFGRRSTINPTAARALGGFLTAGVLGGAIALAHVPQLVSFTGGGQAQPVAAMLPSVQAVRPNQTSSARFENAVFHLSQPTTNSPASRPAKLKLKPHPSSPSVQIDALYSETDQRSSQRVMVLTAWHQTASQPVLVTLPDGRTFVATYAANPNQVGWLIIQL